MIDWGPAGGERESQRCTEHGHLHCRECFPHPSHPLPRRCAAVHPAINRQCQRDADHNEVKHRYESGRHGVVEWE